MAHTLEDGKSNIKRLTVSLEDGGLRQKGVIDSAINIGGGRIAPGPLSPNHIYWRGSELSFGKLTMTDTDLELVDMDPKDPFDFSVDRWTAQLVAGYSKTLPNRGLRAYMPDYNDLAPRAAGDRAISPQRKK